MTNDTPPDWVLNRASRRIGYNDGYITQSTYADSILIRSLCDMIWRYEQPPVDRKLMCVNEAYEEDGSLLWDDKSFDVAVRAIELYEEGFGCD